MLISWEDKTRALPMPADGQVRTGPLRFGSDWPGVFVRGDNAFGFAFSIEKIMEKYPELRETDLAELKRLLDSCQV